MFVTLLAASDSKHVVAQEKQEDIEIIVVEGYRYQPRTFNYMISSLQSFLGDPGRGGSDEWLDEYYRELDDYCERLEGRRPTDCVLNNPPDVSPNGCSVPSGLQTNDVVLAMDRFVQACNNHDRCYSNPSTDKAPCDLSFLSEMNGICMNGNYLGTMANCQNDAYNFYVFLQAPTISQISELFFKRAKKQMACFIWVEAYDDKC